MSEPTCRVLHVGGGAGDAERILEILTASTSGQFDLEWVRTLSEALERLTTIKVGAVLLDLRLPDSAGLEGLHTLVRALPAIPVFVLGQRENHELARSVTQAGARDYLLADRLDCYWLPRAIRQASQWPAEEPTVVDTERVGATLGLIGTGLVTADSTGRLTYMNRMAEALTGWRRVEAADRPLCEVLQVIDCASRERVALQVAAAMTAAVTQSPPSDCVLLRRDGSETAIEHSVTPLKDGLGREIGMRIVLRDVSAVRAMALRMSHLATHDPLTDLPNRALLVDRLGRSLALAQRHHQRLAVLFFDIDRFKAINDTLGHLVGDALLRRVAEEVSTCVRSSDTVGRFGGDEFVVVLAELHHAEDAAKGAQKIIAALARPLALPGHQLHISISMGISVYPEDGEDGETLLTRADMALYYAKSEGRDGYRFFEPSLNQRAVQRQSIEAGLHRALDRQEFELFYQPKIDLKTNAIVGVEALLRWRDPQLGLVAPADFISIAEDCGLIGAIGGWVLGEACRQAQAWKGAGFRPIPVSVNISAVEFRNPGLLQNIVEILRATSLDPRQLEIELTETVLMADIAATNRIINSLKALGVQLAIDDFGTGWSGLNYLWRFPVDALKIDTSFVKEITTDPKAALIVSTMIRLGKGLTNRVIAEGVETREQLAFLRSEECDEAQGYLFSRPLPASTIARLLARPQPHWDRVGEAFDQPGRPAMRRSG